MTSVDLKEATFGVIRRCKECSLHKTRHNVVVGRGVIPAKFMIIGDAPNQSEDILGLPFSGSYGKLFQEMAHDSGLDREECFITNAILCRPCDTESDFRAPKTEELEACSANVLAIAELVKPKVVYLIGKSAGKMKGKLRKQLGNVITLNMIHPSVVLRQGGKASPLYLDCVRIFEYGMTFIN